MAVRSQVRSFDCDVAGCRGRTLIPGGLCSWHRANGTPNQYRTDAPDPPSDEPVAMNVKTTLSELVEALAQAQAKVEELFAALAKEYER